MTMVLMVIMTYHQLLLKQTMETPSRAKNVQLNSVWIKSVNIQNPQWPKQQRCKVSNSLKVWSKPHAFIQSTTNLAYCFLNDRGLTICAASLATQCSSILVNPWWWWTYIWLYELLFQGVPFQVSVDYTADQHSSNCCCQIHASFYFFCNHFCWTDAASSACPWSLEECLRISPSAKTLICTGVGTFCMAATFTQCWDIDHSSASFVWLPLHLLVPQEHVRISTVQYKGKTWILSCVSTKSFTIFVTTAMAFWPKSQVY